MTNPTPKYRRSLNQSQIQLLQTLYKFRFATSYLIAKSQGSKYPRVILARLRVLVDQGYIRQNYDSSYKIKGRPATYFLRLKGIRYLKQQPYANKGVLNSVYHDTRATDTQIAHYLHVFATYVEFKRLYPGEFKFFSKSELAGRKHMPQQLPDAYLDRINKESGQTDHYFLDCFEDAELYRSLVYKIRQLINYAENDTWKKSLTTLPVILMVCESKKLERRMIRIAERELQSSIASLQFKTTIFDTLATVSSRKEAIWRDVEDYEKLVCL